LLKGGALLTAGLAFVGIYVLLAAFFNVEVERAKRILEGIVGVAAVSPTE
jgi:hypothetical protein